MCEHRWLAGVKFWNKNKKKKIKLLGDGGIGQPPSFANIGRASICHPEIRKT